MTETLFGAEVPVNFNNNDSSPYTLGTRFSPLVIGQVTHHRFYRADNPPSGLVEFIIWRNSDQAELAREEVSGASLVAGWNEIPLAVPVTLDVGEAYTASYFTPDYYVSTGTYPWPKTSTDGNLETSSPGGYFSGEFEPSYPDAEFGAASYFADVVFEPSGADPSAGSADLGLGLAVAATGSADAEGSAALGLNLAVAATGSADAEGSAALGIGLAVAATGARPSRGAVSLDLGLAVASTGSAPARGVVDLGLNLEPAAAGARDSSGTTTLSLDLAVSSSGARAAAGASALSLNLALAAQGSDGQAGRPVTPWPYGEREVSGYPWTPRPVKSFTGEVG